MPFLEVLTRCYKRPKMLDRNMASLDVQTCDDWEQTLLVDEVGRGIGWSYTHMAAQADDLIGDFIWILDDDDECIRPTLVEELKGIAQGHDPDVIMVRMDHQERGILPSESLWGYPSLLGEGALGCSAYVVRRSLWQEHAHAFGERYAGDWDFIAAVLAGEPDIFWHDVIASRVQRISLEAAE